jgi:GntR family transcriptional regulator
VANPVNIIISNSSNKPIYEQITDQVKNLILSGELVTGDALPSMRLLAKELRISVITTKRAYEELEREGFIETVTGKGSFVADKNPDLLREEHLKRIEGNLIKACEIAKIAKVSREDLIEMLKIVYVE